VFYSTNGRVKKKAANRPLEIVSDAMTKRAGTYFTGR